jgi:2-oxoglutarate dehydrogenase E2 component (dihydrolipoamide succinyltransferase)
VTPEVSDASAAHPKGEVRIEKLSHIRRRIGTHMVSSRATSPHTVMAMEIDYSAVRAARDEANRAGRPLSYLPFVAFAVAEAIRDFPRVNASVVGDDLHVFPRLNLGIAVDLDFEGLIVPVVRGVAEKSLSKVASEIEDLAARARGRSLTPGEVAHGTFTITNAGGYGTLFTAAIIHQPQVAILSTDGITPKPVAIVRDDDGGYDVAVRPIGVLTLTWDHRAFDGAYAAAFLKRLKLSLENRDWRAHLTTEG